MDQTTVPLVLLTHMVFNVPGVLPMFLLNHLTKLLLMDNVDQLDNVVAQNSMLVFLLLLLQLVK
jgi:hypothetical protein